MEINPINEEEQERLMNDLEEIVAVFNQVKYGRDQAKRLKEYIEKHNWTVCYEPIDKILEQFDKDLDELRDSLSQTSEELNIKVTEITDGSEVPRLRYVMLTDPCYMINNDVDKRPDIWGSRICDILHGQGERYDDTFVIHIEWGFAECYLLFAHTKDGDGSYGFLTPSDRRVEIITSRDADHDAFGTNSWGLCVDAGLIGLATFNDAWKELHQIDLNSRCTKLVNTPARALSINGYEDGDLELYFNEKHNLQMTHYDAEKECDW